MNRYRFRAECIFDVVKALCVLAPEVRSFAVTRDEDRPDCTVIISSDEPVERFRVLLSGVPEGHVMARTIASHDGA